MAKDRAIINNTVATFGEYGILWDTVHLVQRSLWYNDDELAQLWTKVITVGVALGYSRDTVINFLSAHTWHYSYHDSAWWPVKKS